MMAGDFTAIASPACNGGRQITLRAPFVNNRIDPALYSRPAVVVANRLPATSDPCGRIIYGFRASEDDAQGVGRIDYQPTGRYSVFARYLGTHREIPNPFVSDNLLTSNLSGIDNLAQSYSFGDTYRFRPGLVNAFRLTVNR